MIDNFKKLKNSPIYALTLGFKELSHSNFWAWLINLNKNFVKLFFKNDFDVNSVTITVEREKGNRDISINVDNKVYVVENKIKSMPNEEQLKRYENDLGVKFGLGVITGFKNPNFNLKKWKFISYDEISSSILEIMKECELSDANRTIIKEYAEVISAISDLVLEYSNENSNTLELKYNKEIEEIRFDDVCKKLKADEFVQFLKKSICGELDTLRDFGWELDIWSGFTHKTAIIDCRYKKIDVDNREKVIGIQIQGDAYRKAASETGDIKCEDVYERYKNMGWFEETTINRQSKQRKNFCKFESGEGNKKYHFVYQYTTILDFSFDSLRNQILKDLNIAKQIIISQCEMEQNSQNTL